MRHSQVHDRMGNMSMTRMRTARTMKMKPMLNNRLSHRHNQSYSQMLHCTAQRPTPNSSSSSSWGARVLPHKVTRRSSSSYRRFLLPYVLDYPELRHAVPLTSFFVLGTDPFGQRQCRPVLFHHNLSRLRALHILLGCNRRPCPLLSRPFDHICGLPNISTRMSVIRHPPAPLFAPARVRRTSFRDQCGGHMDGERPIQEGLGRS